MTNRILEALSSSDRGALDPHLEWVALKKKRVLEAPAQNIDCVYFFESGIAAVMTAGGHGRVAAGLIGCEGASGLALILGASSTPNSLEILTDATALRIQAPALRQVMSDLPDFNRLLLRFCLAFNYQASQTALANAVTGMEQRVARWVLMAQDRAAMDEVHISHEIIAAMLGVRRAGVSEVLGQFSRAKLIRAERGLVEVLDRAALKKIAGPSYGLPEKEYKRLVNTTWPLDPEI